MNCESKKFKPNPKTKHPGQVTSGMGGPGIAKAADHYTTSNAQVIKLESQNHYLSFAGRCNLCLDGMEYGHRAVHGWYGVWPL
eukprot:16452157-Heterocapsa_arctica.AAC.1